MPSASKTTIGQRLRKIRESRGMTLRQVEAKTGIGVSHLSQIENDLRNINVAKLEKLAACYGCEVADFFPRRGRGRSSFSRGTSLSRAQEEVLQAMEDKAVARHMLEQARMRLLMKRSQARRRQKG